MATYYKKPMETPETNKQQMAKEYSVIANNEQIEIPERYVSAVEKIAILRRLCAREVEKAKANEYTLPALDVALIMAVIGDE